MSGTVKSDRARATRRRVVDTAHRLFLDRGYAATTIQQIATDAGIAVQTVYFHFGNKATVLKELLDVLAVGDDEPVPLLDRPWVRQLREETDGRRALAIWVGQGHVILTRVAPVMRILRDAAGADPEMAAQWATNQQQTLTAHRSFTDQLAALHALRPGLTPEHAADIIYTLTGHEVYSTLTTERGWTGEQWQQWTLDTLAATLLRGPAETAPDQGPPRGSSDMHRS